MKPIQLVDLLGQYNKIKDEIDKAVLDVVGSSAYIMGPEMKQFETELANYLNAKHVIGCANGTDALQIALMALDLQPGDEVITPSFTYIATAEVIALLHLKSVFVDVDPETFTVTPEAIEKAISPNTKAIIPVHLYGQCADMEPILEIAKKHNLAVIEDTAQAIGAEYTFSDGSSRKAGTMGDFGCTSFFPSKNLGAFGDGGAIFTNNDELNKKVRMIANHGQKRKYYHDVIGVNSRLDSIQAAVLRIKLKHLDEYAAARNHAADFYDEKLANISDISVPKRSEKSTHVFHQYSLKLNGMERDAFQEELKAKGIPSNVYYPLPIHLQKGFEKADCRKEDLSVTEDLMQHVISLPMHTELTEDQLQYITDTVTEFAKKNVSVSQPV
ncbi:MAG: transcriptional regulator [Flavobacteriales bacterium]|nr:MAG: transcriptional regulator [Flavobacteriales bacterium]